MIEEDRHRQIENIKEENQDLDSETINDKIREIEEKIVGFNGFIMAICGFSFFLSLGIVHKRAQFTIC